MCKIEDNNGKIYYYNRDAGYLIDSIGTKIKIGEILMVLRKKIFHYMWLICLNPIMKQLINLIVTVDLIKQKILYGVNILLPIKYIYTYTL